ncbi:MAG: TrmH family RNA methyltransferase [Anaerolineales bacterium]
MITSLHNPRIKEIRLLNSASKHRLKSGLYAAEGIRLLEEALQAGQRPELVIYTEDLDQRGSTLVEHFQSLSVLCEPVTSQVLQAASDTESPQGILAVLPISPLALPDQPNLVLILDAIRDPGNLGTLMRTCLAAGADGLLLGPGTVDSYSPKVVRSAMGAHFRLPVVSASWKEIASLTRGMGLYLADMDQGESLWEADLTKPLGIILGGEAHGPGKQARSLAGESIHIPMEAPAESLNAAIAGAILLFEVKRQRAKGS